MVNTRERSATEQPITLGVLKQQIPHQCFEKSLGRSLFYMIRDILLISTCYFTYDFFSTTWLGLFVYWNIYGFLMWCLFVIGHDCGHGSFSRYPIINAICGHLCHTPLLVPFFPWAYSHRKHHQFHNHKEKDHSHPWFTEKELKSNKVKHWYLTSFLAPLTGYGAYLYAGTFDGSHVIPWGRLFRAAGQKEQVKCAISGFTILGFMALLLMVIPSWSQFFLGYFGCWVVFAFWLFMVTYLQHHDFDTVVYDDSNWDFVTSALQTVDRKFGFGIDKFHHNSTDCHLAHHLFFTQIPHYHLQKATQAMGPILGRERKFRRHKFFLIDFWRLFFRVNFTQWTLGNTMGQKKNPDSG